MDRLTDFWDYCNPLSVHANVYRQQRNLLLEARSRKGQKPTDALKRSRAKLEESFFTMALDLRLGNLLPSVSEGEVLRTTFIGESYRPCIKPLSSLVPITLDELKLEIHHRGRVLLAKVFCEPIYSGSILNAIEDIHGNVDCLSMFHQPTTEFPTNILPKGAIIAVKEPYYKLSSDRSTIVRVDHPSDCMLLKPSHEMVPSAWQQVGRVTVRASRMKDKGNDAFKKGDWEAAVNLYSDGLAMVSDDEGQDDLRRTLYRNRAQARIHLGHFELAVDDATASIIPGKDLSEESKALNLKSLFRAGRAYYELAEFTLARSFFEQAEALGIEDENVHAELDRTKKRLLEQEKGEYDFVEMAASPTFSHTELDHASFLSNTKIDLAGSHGRGLFATKDIKHGEIVMVEKAFCAAMESNTSKTSDLLVDTNTHFSTFGTHSRLLFRTVEKLRWNHKLANKYLDLYAGPSYKKKEARIVDDTVIIDIFQVEVISQFNGFVCAQVKTRLPDESACSKVQGSTGIWLHASYANHSCLENTGRAFIGDMMILRASRDIKAGEEITTAYFVGTEPTIDRKRKMSYYLFNCDCRLCAAERKVSILTLVERDRLTGLAERFIIENACTNLHETCPAPDDKLKFAQDLQSKLTATYDAALYKDLPRFACMPIDAWLCQSDPTPSNGIVSSTRLLRDLGYKISVKGGELTIDRTNGVFTAATAHGAMYAARAWAVAGRYQVVPGFIQFGKEVYLAYYGEMDEFSDLFGLKFFLAGTAESGGGEALVAFLQGLGL
ncbi:hypothetical protein M406DRAFT_73986 [Cryphonectria parasitica EP155]|uniref:SET domain-containing protein n=1 Tax=Cryphonectria parasitica (strain ATCC 38755 / EP155) TaxID=660469 RepID=A0A9P5CMY9_CRYP1|nr:uncharacterized protein M406DRAFT_73986 [Cryphonectria parasitica EP155]KAF3763370.1 hypothetical protein M406DRAFT_73986 [Cryphonectria parasitica EP155]